jgi:hypothetical protein
MMSLPTSVEPVKESLLIIGWLASGAPHSSPSPVNTLSTPGGKNSWHTSASISTPSGASSAAFKTSVLLAQSAGPILRAASRTVDEQPETWTGEGVREGLTRFYREIAGVGLVFPRADRSIAVEYPEDAVITLHPIEGLEFVLEAVAALGNSSELAGHLFREALAQGH